VSVAAVVNSYLNNLYVTVGNMGVTGVTTAVTPDGSNFWFTGGSGSFYVAGGTGNRTAQLASGTPVSGAYFLEGWVYRVSSAIGGLGVLGLSSTTSTTPGIFTSSTVMTAQTGTPSTSSLFMETPLIAWILDAGNATASPALYRFTRIDNAVNTPWTATSGYPAPVPTLDLGGGATVTPTQAAGLTGFTDPSSGTTHLLLGTSNAGLLRFDPSTQTYSQFYAPCAPAANTRYVGVSLAPWVPTPSVTASATASNTPSPSATMSFGSSPSATASITASASATAPPTVTPTASATPYCAPPGPAVTFTPGNLVLVRVGGGRDAISTDFSVAREVFLDEVTPGGTLVQTIELPAGPVVLNATGGLVSSGCTINAAFVNNGLLTRSPDGLSLVLACNALARGEAVTTTSNKTIVSVSYTGAARVAAVVTQWVASDGVTVAAGSGTTSMTGAVTNGLGDYWYGASSGGVYSISNGRVGRAYVSSTTGAVGLAFQDGWVYRMSPAGALGVLGNGSTTVTVPNVFTNSFTLTGASP
jgi:hypothetical protein